MSFRDEVNAIMGGQAQLTSTDTELILHLAKCTLAKTSKKDSWLEEEAVSGLP